MKTMPSAFCRKMPVVLRTPIGLVNAMCFVACLVSESAHAQDIEKKTLRGHRAAVLYVAFVKDGSHLASGDAGKTLKLWDLGTNRTVRDWPRRPAASLAVNRNGHLASGGNASGDEETWGDVIVFLDDRTVELGGVQSLANAVAFSPRGMLAVAGASIDPESGRVTGVIKIWQDPATVQQPARQLPGRNGAAFHSVAFSPLAKYGFLVAGSGGNGQGQVTMWGLPGYQREVIES